ncbi:geranylgeranylglycerol-phosphate geranylgeranyltransferase [Sungkyunkwania multivorans]|uniref:Geranylgeranylglycerol-phosphate geranylgeranyltransferase n=1 Tax=Sungkyunkwania multivorans TaxID=1173618 RepID=A0ABW3D283_9FLAO
MPSRKQKMLMLKLLSLFSVVRGYNILVITLAQYLASIYILAPDRPALEVIFDLQLFMLVTATALAIAGGYIINNFYDAEKDLINRPKKSMLDRIVSQRFKLTTYFVLNFASVFFASYVSFRAVVFFSVYIFGIWFYSHKLKRLPFVGNLTSAILSITPFFAVFIYYKNFDTVIFVHATFLFLLISMRELVKDLENLPGDMAQDYRTIPIVYGERISKIFLSGLTLLTLIPIYLLINRFHIGYMYLYFYSSVLVLTVFLVLLWQSNGRRHYVLLHNILKFIIVLGVFGILLIDIDLVLSRIF